MELIPFGINLWRTARGVLSLQESRRVSQLNASGFDRWKGSPLIMSLEFASMKRQNKTVFYSWFNRFKDYIVQDKMISLSNSLELLGLLSKLG